MIKSFYTYLWLREDGTPYYVGKGSYPKRAKERHKVGNTVRYAPDNIIVQEFENEYDAFFSEKFLIAYYGRKDIGTGILRNQTDGGEGNTGSGGEGRARQINFMKNRTFSEEHRNKISKAKMGNKACLGKRETHCKRGHEFNLENIYIVPSRGQRQCATCRKEQAAINYRNNLEERRQKDRERYLRKKNAAP